MPKKMKKETLKTYEIYTITCGHKSLLYTTTSRKEAVNFYSKLCGGGALPRIAIDGKQLTIAECIKFNNPTIASKAGSRWGKYARRPEFTTHDSYQT